MGDLKKRGLSLLLAFIMIVSLLAGVTFPAASAAGTVDYVYSGKYVYNWGSRGTDATFLSPMAEDWYEKYNVTFDELMGYSGSSNRSSVPSSALYRELQDLMSDAQSYVTSYDATKSLFKYTDCQNSGGKISSFYSGTGIGPDWNSSWNREHTWPNSKGSGSAENDIMMLRPTSISENSSRGNTAYGESSSYYHPNSESNGKYDLRGDVARIMLYVYCRWGNTGSMWGSGGVMENETVLLKWVEEDPVDTWELGRNDAVQSITGTRNVFVDYPELIFQLFGRDVPEDYTTPSGEGAGVSYTVTAQSSNTAYGTVSVSGRTITATPKTGYYVSGHTVVSGSATVTQEGNTFRVSASSDCTVRIHFAAKTAATVTFTENGTTTKTQNTYLGDAITLPSPTATPEGYTFMGWVESTVDDTVTMPALTVRAAGASYTPTASTTFYALYQYIVEDGGNTATTEVVFQMGSDGSASHEDTSTAKSGYSETVGNYTLSLKNGSQLYPNSRDAKGNGALKIGSGSKTGAFSFTVPEEVNSVILAVAAYKDNNLTIVINDGAAQSISTKSNDGAYTNITVDTSTNKTVTFATSTGPRAMIDSITYIAGSAGTTHYTTVTECSHSGGTVNVPEQAPTCIANGYTAGVQCTICEAFISGHTRINATGHTFDDGICTVCGRSESAPGDVNGDGKINSLDGLLLMRYLNNWDLVINSPEAMDVNADGKVNSLDGLLLMRYLNDWDITLG